MSILNFQIDAKEAKYNDIQIRTSDWMYQIRGCVILMTITLHFIGLDPQTGLQKLWEQHSNIPSFLAFIEASIHGNMPALFMITGMNNALYAKKKDGFLAFFKGRLKYLLIPYLVWYPIYAGILLLAKHNLTWDSYEWVIFDIAWPKTGEKYVYWFLNVLIYVMVIQYIAQKYSTQWDKIHGDEIHGDKIHGIKNWKIPQILWGMAILLALFQDASPLWLRKDGFGFAIYNDASLVIHFGVIFGFGVFYHQKILSWYLWWPRSRWMKVASYVLVIAVYTFFARHAEIFRLAFLQSMVDQMRIDPENNQYSWLMYATTLVKASSMLMISTIDALFLGKIYAGLVLWIDHQSKMGSDLVVKTFTWIKKKHILIGQNTVFLYLFHMYIIAVFWKILERFFLQKSAVILATVSLIMWVICVVMLYNFIIFLQWGSQSRFWWIAKPCQLVIWSGGMQKRAQSKHTPSQAAQSE